MQYTPEKITSLKPNQVFVFGSNTEGIHGAGAARIAKEQFGAIYGQAEGLQGQSYAIITKDLGKGERSIHLLDIYESIKRLITFAKENPQLEFLVTKIGCNLAGFKEAEIAKLWEGLAIPDNIILPLEFDWRKEAGQCLT